MVDAQYIEAPSNPDLRALYAYWDGLRHGRLMPRRTDIDPTQIPKLLPYAFMYNAAPDGSFTIRLAGEELTTFLPKSPVGQAAGSTMTQSGAEMIVQILAAVVRDRAPKFRAGKAHWQPNRAHHDFEACFLPLSSDGETVDVIFGAIKF
jgi:hypothetical protein